MLIAPQSHGKNGKEPVKNRSMQEIK